MALINRNMLPPGGYQYREAAINWTAPNPGLPFELVAEQIQLARANNPASGLDVSLEACSDALDLFTCTRLKFNPKWCVTEETPVARAARESRKPAKCASCGARKRKGKTQ